MINDKTNLKITNVCYANVSMNFAMFCNPKYRGENFTWGRFIEMQASSANEWVIIYNLANKKNKNEVFALAKLFADEIARSMVIRAGFDS